MDSLSASAGSSSDARDDSETRPNPRRFAPRRIVLRRSYRDLLRGQMELLDQIVDHIDRRIPMLLECGLQCVDLSKAIERMTDSSVCVRLSPVPE